MQHKTHTERIIVRKAENCENYIVIFVLNRVSVQER